MSLIHRSMILLDSQGVDFPQESWAHSCCFLLPSRLVKLEVSFSKEDSREN